MNGDISLIGLLLSVLIYMRMGAASSSNLHSKQLDMTLALQLIHNSLQSPVSVTSKSVQILIMNLEQPRHVQECTLYRLWSLASHRKMRCDIYVCPPTPVQCSQTASTAFSVSVEFISCQQDWRLDTVKGIYLVPAIVHCSCLDYINLTFVPFMCLLPSIHPSTDVLGHKLKSRGRWESPISLMCMFLNLWKETGSWIPQDAGA